MGCDYLPMPLISSLVQRPFINACVKRPHCLYHVYVIIDRHRTMMVLLAPRVHNPPVWATKGVTHGIWYCKNTRVHSLVRMSQGDCLYYVTLECFTLLVARHLAVVLYFMIISEAIWDVEQTNVTPTLSPHGCCYSLLSICQWLLPLWIALYIVQLGVTCVQEHMFVIKCINGLAHHRYYWINISGSHFRAVVLLQICQNWAGIRPLLWQHPPSFGPALARCYSIVDRARPHYVTGLLNI